MGPSPIDPMINEPAATEAVMQMHVAEAEVSRRSMLRGAVAALVAPALLAACADLDKSNIQATEAEATTTSEKPAPTTTEVTPTTLSPEAWTDIVEKQIGERFKDFKEGELSVGEDNIDMSKNKQEAGATAFNAGYKDGDNVVESTDEAAEYIASDHKGAQILRDRANLLLANEPDEIQRFTNAEGFLPVQANVAVVINGTTYLVDGEMKKMTAGRYAGAGDTFWLFVKKDGKIVWDVSFRADCINPELDMVRPHRPGEPEIPSITEYEDKTPVPRSHDAHSQRGDGGQPEQGMDPENDSDVDGYGPGDTPTITVPQTSHPQATVPPSPNTTSAPHKPSPTVPATTQAPRPTVTSPQLGD